MTVVFRASDVPVARRRDYWRHVIDDHLVPMDVRFEDGPDVRDEVRTGMFGTVRVSESATGPGEARRTAEHIRRCDPDLYQLFVQVSGTGVGEQNGHRAALRPGDLSLTDLSRPFRCVHPARRAVLVTFPRASMPLPRADVARLTGARIRGDRGDAALVSRVARRLPRHLEDGAGPARLGTAVLDLLTVALAGRLDHRSAAPPEAHQRTLRLRISGYIDARLADPGLNPATVAAAHHISVRFLHKLFEAEEQSVAALIRRRRLEGCRRDLSDPALARRPVSATAARWGFANPAHFNRLFRETYGLPPGEFRLTCAGNRSACSVGTGLGLRTVLRAR